jgi:hypothetical protein
MPKIQLSLYRFIFLAMLGFILNSCLKEDFNVKNFALSNNSPGIAIPLINASLNVRDVYNFDSSGWTLKEDNSNFLSLIYKKTETFGADSFLHISDQSLAKQKYIFKIDNTIPLGDSTSDVYITNLDFISSDNDIYDTLYIKSGSLDILILSTLNMKGQMIFSLPEATKDGKMLTSQIKYPGKPNDSIKTKVDLSGYKIIFTHQGRSNIVTTVCKVMAYNTGAKNNSPYTVSLTVDLKNIKFSKLYGYFSSRTFNFFDFLSVKLFGGIKKGDSYIEDPSLKLLISNSVGIPAKLDIIQFNSHSDVKTPHDLAITGLPSSINIPSPPKPGIVTYIDYLLNKNNSNIRDAINLSPTGFLYNVNGITMPIPAIQNFIFDYSKIDLDVEIELPLFGWMKNFVINDTFDFSIDNLENFESLTFNLIVDNGFPLEATLQLYFFDSNTIMLDSMFVNPQNFLRSAITDVPSGKVIKPVSRLYTIVFDNKRVKKLIKCRKMHFKASMYTTNKGKNSIKIYSDYSLDIKLSALAKIKTN